MGNIFTDLFSSKPAEEAARMKAAGFAQGKTDANYALDTGMAAARPLYDQAYSDFSSLAGKFGKGFDAYGDATGVNGADGISRAAALFKSLPGYSGGLNTGLDLLERRAAARGDLGGGNMSADTIKYASDYDANKYGQYVSSLAPNLSGALSATSGGAGVLGSEAGSNLALAGQRANFDYNAATGTGQANADAALAPYSASQNFWSSLMGGANMALRASGVGGYAPSAGPISRGGPGGPAPFWG
ncbi:MAG: hypothetical protein WC807_21120 [Hyphomicrobium sp.]|jgi:hypothetical protein